jgi:hypothetical protein
MLQKGLTTKGESSNFAKMDAHTSPHGTLGALQIGSSLSLFLFGILTVQAYLYFDRFRDDRWTLKAFVSPTAEYPF